MSETARYKIKIFALAFILFGTGSVAAECPSVPEPHIPPPPLPLNIDQVKDLLLDYHDSDYLSDVSAVFSVAQAYIEERASTVKKPAVVLDIDETSLSNWPALVADDFGFISNGRCDNPPAGPCGFNAWILRAKAEAIPPALKFFNAIKDKGIAIIFITARPNTQRQATLRNLQRAGFNGWTKLVTRHEHDSFPSVQAYKTDARSKIAREYAIIASIGDQQSDIDQEPNIKDGKPECGFKIPNPFYFIK